MRSRTCVVALSAAVGLALSQLAPSQFPLSIAAVQAAPFMIVGNDEKILWDDQGKPIL